MSKWMGGVALLVAVGASLVAADKDADERNPKTVQQFLMKAMGDGVAEVKLGELAEKRAGSEKVKEFGRHMVRDHSKANAKLRAFALKHKLAVLEGMPKEKQQLYNRLADLKGSAFDRAYMAAMVEGHQKAVDLFQAGVKKGADADLAEFTKTTLPTLKEHLEEARSVSKALEGKDRDR